MERQIVITEKEYAEYEKALKIFKDAFTMVNEPVYALDGRGAKMAYFNKIYMELNLDKLAENLGWVNMKFRFTDGDGIPFGIEHTTEELRKTLS